MHDYIFHHQHTLEDADLTRFAEAVGLQMQQFTRALAEQHSLASIEEEREGGERSGVQGTPTFFIDGVLYPGSWQQDALLAALQVGARGERRPPRRVACGRSDKQEEQYVECTSKT